MWCCNRTWRRCCCNSGSCNQNTMSDYQRGYNAGYSKGFNEGQNSGYNTGFNDGYQRGLEVCASTPMPIASGDGNGWGGGGGRGNRGTRGGKRRRKNRGAPAPSRRPVPARGGYIRPSGCLPGQTPIKDPWFGPRGEGEFPAAACSRREAPDFLPVSSGCPDR